MADPVELLVEDPRWNEVGLDALAGAAFHGVAKHRGFDPGTISVSVLACDDTRIAALNAAFRDKPQPTNVLSWPSEERGAEEDGGDPAPLALPMDEELGDIAIAFETCAREADEQALSMEDHVSHLIVHGILHLLGYDHERDKDAALMERLEVEILASMGIANPYEQTGAKEAS